MKITLLTYGTRGDVQPFIALGLGLEKAGHSVRLAAPGVFEEFVRGYGLDFHPLPGDPAELSRLLVDQGQRSAVGTVRAMTSFAIPVAVEVMRSSRDACRDADAVVHSFLLTLAGHAMARERGIPDFSAQTFPTFATSCHTPSMAAPGRSLGRLYNLITHWLMDQTFYRASLAAYAVVRRGHPDLPSRIEWPFGGAGGRPRTPILMGISPHVYPPQPDWPAGVHVTGYWFLDDTAGWTPPDALSQFLDDDPPPVCVGFGSVVTGRAGKLGRIAQEALVRSGLRGVLLGGWSGIGGDATSSGEVLRLESAPHSWLFPRVAAVAHHGGAGTTAAGLRAGTPSVLTPFSSDQPFWASRIERLGVGPKPIPVHRLTADRLAGALRTAATDESIRARATALGEKIRAEDGVARAVEIIQDYLERT